MEAFDWFVRVALVGAATLFSYNCAGREAALREGATAPRDQSTGIMRGAEPIRIDRGRPRACLLLHGWLGTPADYADLPRALDAAGWDVYAPLMPGHGTQPLALEGVTAQDWLTAARTHYQEVAGRYPTVALGGFSMGGAMATILASERPPDYLVLVAPFYEVTYKWYYVLPARAWSRVLTPFLPYVTRSRDLVRLNDKSHRDEIVTYNTFPTTASEALFELRRITIAEADPARLTMPVLLVYSTGDEAAAPSAMERFFGELPAGAKRQVTFRRSNHHLLHDYDRQEAIAAIVEFLGA